MATDVVITDDNFSQYFKDVRQHVPERGQVIARFTAVAQLVDGRLKRDVIDLLRNTDKAIPASNVLRKLGGATEVDSLRVCIEMAQDMLAGLSDDEVAAKVYEFQYEAFYYTLPKYVPEGHKNWSVISIMNLDEFVDQAGTKLKSSWKFEKRNPVSDRERQELAEPVADDRKMIEAAFDRFQAENSKENG